MEKRIGKKTGESRHRKKKANVRSENSLFKKKKKKKKKKK
jgi:hypothetical protein